jgi:hypothetical protein
MPNEVTAFKSRLNGRINRAFKDVCKLGDVDTYHRPYKLTGEDGEGDLMNFTFKLGQDPLEEFTKMLMDKLDVHDMTLEEAMEDGGINYFYSILEPAIDQWIQAKGTAQADISPKVDEVLREVQRTQPVEFGGYIETTAIPEVHMVEGTETELSCPLDPTVAGVGFHTHPNGDANPTPLDLIAFLTCSNRMTDIIYGKSNKLVITKDRPVSYDFKAENFNNAFNAIADHMNVAVEAIGDQEMNEWQGDVSDPEWDCTIQGVYDQFFQAMEQAFDIKFTRLAPKDTIKATVRY